MRVLLLTMYDVLCTMCGFVFRRTRHQILHRRSRRLMLKQNRMDLLDDRQLDFVLRAQRQRRLHLRDDGDVRRNLKRGQEFDVFPLFIQKGDVIREGAPEPDGITLLGQVQ